MQFFTRFATRLLGARARILMTLTMVMAFAGSAGAPSLLQRAAGPDLQISAPRQVEVGQPIEIQLTARGVADIAGYELNVLYDPAAAEFDALRQRKNDLKKFGRDVAPLGPVEMSNGVAIGLTSCPVASCVDGKGAKKKGANGTVRLATLVLLAKQPGALEIKLDAPKFVAADGTAVALALSTQTVVVQVGAGGARHPAPAGKWTLRPAATAPAAAPDLTGDRLVSYADTAEVVLGWTLARERGSPCASLDDPSRDVNRDGCVDVSDAQIMAASEGPAASTSALPQAIEPAAGLTLTVNSTGDGSDANLGDGVCAASGGVCTLRAAIAEANAHAGPDTIEFNIPGSAVQTIQLGSRLPSVSDASGPTTIDGYSQPGATPNSDPSISNAAIKVQIRGGGPAAYDALFVTSAGNVFRGLAFYNLRHAFWMSGSGATDNVIAGNFVGTDAAGSFGFTAETAGSSGIQLTSGAGRTRIGGTAPADRNVISGNSSFGIATYYEATDNNLIINNIIGLGPRGDKRLTNWKHGVDINSDSSYNQIGGTAPGERNVISGNVQNGVELSHGTMTVQNKVIGNYIGTGIDGTSAGAAFAYNSGWGVQVEDGVNNSLISDNVIGNSRLGGAHLEGYNTIANQFANNRIGVGLDGSSIPNSNYGLQIGFKVSRITVGPGNIIANQAEGIQVVNPDNDFNTITRNSIYNNAGRGIDLGPLDPVNPNLNDANDLDSGANDQLNFPVLTSATTTQVSGTACADAVVPKPCTIEVFLADHGAGAYGEGRTFLGATTTSGGAFTVAIGGVSVGDYVTSTATDADGNTSEFGRNIVVASGSPAPTPTATATPAPGGTTVYAADSFTRQVTDGWGSAEVGGGYSLEAASRPAADYDVDGSAGTMLVAAADQWHSAYLPAVSAQDVDLSFRVKTDKANAGGYQFVYAVARRVAAGTQYMGRLNFSPNGGVLLQAAKSKSETVTLLGSEVGVAGLTHTANAYIRLRMQVSGTSPSTIRLKAWADGQAEPSSWQVSVTDSDPDLQAPGEVGMRTIMTSSNTNFPVLFSFDDLRAASIGAAAPTPTATPTAIPTATPTVTPTPGGATTYVDDSFSRSVVNSWGSAGTGGAYTLSGTAADFDVDGSAGTITSAANATRSAYLASTSALDVDVTVRIKTDKIAAGGSQMAYFVARRVSNGSDYLGRLRLSNDNTVRLQAFQEVGGAATAIGAEKTVAGLTQSASSYIWLRGQVVGTNPTTIRLKAWADGQPEPSTWAYSFTDSTASLQAPGGLGLRTYLSSAATNAPVVFSFDDFLVTSAAGS